MLIESCSSAANSRESAAANGDSDSSTTCAKRLAGARVVKATRDTRAVRVEMGRKRARDMGVGKMRLVTMLGEFLGVLFVRFVL